MPYNRTTHGVVLYDGRIESEVRRNREIVRDTLADGRWIYKCARSQNILRAETLTPAPYARGSLVRVIATLYKSICGFLAPIRVLWLSKCVAYQNARCLRHKWLFSPLVCGNIALYEPIRGFKYHPVAMHTLTSPFQFAICSWYI